MTRSLRFPSFALTSLLVALCCTGPAAAGSQGPSYTISTTVAASCQSISATVNGQTATSYSIGTAYDPFTYGAGNPLKNTTPLILSTNCTLNDAISWTVGIGNNCNKATSNDRAMTDGSSHYLGYQLYTTNAFGVQYGTNSCGTPAAISQTGGGTGTANTINLYGEVPGGQNAYVNGSGPTTYTDTITVTLSY